MITSIHYYCVIIQTVLSFITLYVCIIMTLHAQFNRLLFNRFLEAHCIFPYTCMKHEGLDWTSSLAVLWTPAPLACLCRSTNAWCVTARSQHCISEGTDTVRTVANCRKMATIVVGNLQLGWLVPPVLTTWNWSLHTTNIVSYPDSFPRLPYRTYSYTHVHLTNKVSQSTAHPQHHPIPKLLHAQLIVVHAHWYTGQD